MTVARVLPVARAIGISTVAVLPPLLTGALAVQLRAELGLRPLDLGVAVAAFFAVAGLSARLLGGVAQRLGAVRGMVIAGLLSGAALLTAAVAPTRGFLVVALVCGGLGNALAHPAANLSLSQTMRDNRLGLALGVKQAGIPAAGLLAGLAVPGIALVFGWRWAFASGALLALAAVGLAATARVRPALQPDPGRSSATGAPPRGLWLLAAGAGLGAAAASSLGVFLVDGAVADGLNPGTAGLIAAGASAGNLAGRVLLGAAADRRPRRNAFSQVAVLLVVGVAGYVLLALGGRVGFVLGAVVAYGAGWGWPGLFHYGVVTANRDAPGAATGIAQTGLSLGAAAGPLAFGALVERFSYDLTWLVAGAVTLLAAAVIVAARRQPRANPAAEAATAEKEPKMRSFFARARSRAVLAALLVALLSASCGEPPGSQNRMAIATGGTGGVFFVYGGRLAELISTQLQVPTIAEATSASVDNMKLIGNGDVDLAFVIADTASDGVVGTPAFSQPVPARVLAQLYTSYTHVVAKADSGIRTVEDLRGRRVSIGSPGSGTEVLARRILEVAGLNPDTDISRQGLSVAESAAAVRDGTIDAFFWGGGSPTGSVTDLATTDPITMIPTGQYVPELQRRFGPAYQVATVPGGTYGGQDADVTVVGLGNFLVVPESMDPERAYRLTRLLFEHKQDLVSAHPEAENLSLEAARIVVPLQLHPGAQRYYDEVG